MLTVLRNNSKNLFIVIKTQRFKVDNYQSLTINYAENYPLLITFTYSKTSIMKKIFIFFCCLSISPFISINAKNLHARLAYATYYAPSQGPYIETYLSVSGKSVVFAPLPNGKFQAAIEVSMTFSLNDEIKHFDKYNLLSPEADDSVKTAFNFLDQQRISLPNGTYKFELAIRDKNQSSKPYVVIQVINVDYHSNIMAFSDIELLDSYKAATTENKLNKGGYDLIPFVDNYIPDALNNLKFYAEIYNANNVIGTDGFVLNYYIETYENHKVLENYSRIQRLQAKPVNAFIKELDITELPSGNYNLVLETRNRMNELLASKELFFQRNKSLLIGESDGDYHALRIDNTFVSAYTEKDTLAEYIRCLAPISGPHDILFANNQLGLADLKLMQQFFYSFWEKKNPENPYLAWMTYKTEVDKVNAAYSSINKKGYATERGRVYLQYGPPNSISKEYNEPTAYPYEIWHYYKVKTQSNKKFVFFNPDIVGNDFQLIHSDAIGEPFDAQWQLRINKRTEVNSDFDRTNSSDSYGKHSNDIFTNPH